MIAEAVKNRILPLKMLLLDVDGVLTSGDIIYNDNGEETKVFNVKDGLGIRLLMDAGIKVGIITGRRSGALTARCGNLGIDLVYDGVKDKVAVLEKIVKDQGLAYNDIAYIGDDLPDIGIMNKAGCGFSVRNACRETQDAALYVATQDGGKGAVREISELILKTQGLWEQVTRKFL